MLLLLLVGAAAMFAVAAAWGTMLLLLLVGAAAMFAVAIVMPCC